jgi:hypothetical protein
MIFLPTPHCVIFFFWGGGGIGGVVLGQTNTDLAVCIVITKVLLFVYPIGTFARIADPHPFNADLDPDLQECDVNLRPLAYIPSLAPFVLSFRTVQRYKALHGFFFNLYSF